MIRLAIVREAELWALLTASQNGDDAAYERFLTLAATALRGFVRRRVDGRIDAEDVVQEALLAIHLKRHTWRQDSPAAPWLFAIARYKLVDAYRRQGRRIEVDISDLADVLAAPEPEESLSARDLGRALEALSGGQRRVVHAIAVDGRTVGETAEVLGMKEGAVRVALHRGLKAIAARFTKS